MKSILQSEKWKRVKGYESRYAVSNYGRVKRLSCVTFVSKNGNEYTKNLPEKIMAQTDNGHGYMIVQLSKNKRRKNEYVHRLVAEAFVRHRDGKSIVNHIDFNTKNNSSDNLEWCTQKENVQHSVNRMKKRRAVCTSNTGERYISKQKNGLFRLTLDGKQIGTYKTLHDAKSARFKIEGW